MGNRRVNWDVYYLGLCDSVAVRADCTRRQVGAVLVNDEHRHVSSGYNGAPPGEPGCLSNGACPRGRHYHEQTDYRGEMCACGKSWPCSDASAPGSDYSNCIAIHAEENAIADAAQRGVPTKDTTMYCTDEPCYLCWKLIKAAGVVRVVWNGGNWDRNKKTSWQEGLRAILKL